MLNIKCPYCGERAQKEFAYGGDGTIKRPELDKWLQIKSGMHLFMREKVQEENM